ncbi:nitroimidazol reductase NimA-like FMN-containing flavoprotein (pyridoxamine 5'-phosphate oxidase superfamily) [Thermocatellispora tengchongensis]|uniref:Nitroimidazol reductase NimA-like FMN-containing flavoprotein (Pyridoxamine 5'-phosphate oxidase superfamily) n=1 Tax=Thermocatellispora tengchongensis TaxID=1073253 RepID=A0A840PE55_9ACTN|nr:pyridoxamine 5'-phosphate oxidase family protein [Thermocatellispora tengchongensis]MBB5135730.1 nitroimidazol reductase NimA-like FMN-containing flavoprotein (pyridoxamine 5'-phosphate oxidase superfamily) [Thermocatellispora tengchongensis]
MNGQERLIKPLSEAESLERLAGVSLGRLVFTYQALPDIRPVNHVLDDGHVIVRSHVGAAAVSAVAGLVTVVAYEADDIDHETHLGWSVIVRGTAELVRDPLQVERYRGLLRPWVSGHMDHVIRIKPEIVTGIELVPGA